VVRLEVAITKSEYDRATLVPAAAVTVERIDRAMHTVASMMVKHDMPHLIVTIRFLEAAQEKLQQETAAMDYAKEILRKRA
jgi:HAMP domain-containing protein